ncbi:MAG TPA: polysaccharide biosynthesis tyrosine autokinase [Gemmataceae bacterium]|jgi:capsular exopolysaccharide synthesis family protein|nr:polysaccharide biosynthesis tyrosine autokinase [Gemmataceae bacterium]
MIPVRIEARPDDDGFRNKPDPAIIPLPGVARRPEREPAAPKRPPAEEIGPRDIVNALRYHSVAFVILGSLLGGALGTAAWLLVPAKYTTYAMVNVLPREPVILDTKAGADRTGDFEYVLKTQAAIINSTPIITGALSKPGIAQLAMVRDQANPVEYFAEELKPEITPGSQIIKVTLSGKDAVEIQQFVNAVVEFYRDKVKEDNKYKMTNYNRLLGSKRELEKLRDDAKKYIESQPGAMPLQQMTALQNERLSNYLTARRALRENQGQLAMYREVLRSAESELAKVEAAPAQVPDLAAKMENDRTIAAKKRAIDGLKSSIEDYRRRRLNPNDTTLAEMMQKLEQTKVEYDALRTQFQVREEQAVREALKAEQAKNVATVKAQVDGLQIVERINTLRLQDPEFKDIDLETGAKVLSAESEKAMEAYRRYGEQITQFETSLMAQKVNLDAQERISIYEWAPVPTKRDIKKQVAITGVAGLFGFGLVGGCVSLAEIRRKRVYSPKDAIFQPSRLALLGVIPEHGAPRRGADITRPAADVTGRAFVEAVDKLRTAIGRVMARRKMQVLLVTSAAPDEGKSILAWNLALSSARADRRTLFIDANLKNPGLHNHFDIASHPGLSEMLRGDKPVEQVVQRTALDNLWCIAAGVCDDTARQALDKDGLRRLIERSRQDFDCVVIDSCSIQEAVDPLYIAQRADGTVLSLRTFRSRVGAVEKAVDRLALAGGQLLGAVLTDATGAAYEM